MNLGVKICNKHSTYKEVITTYNKVEVMELMRTKDLIQESKKYNLKNKAQRVDLTKVTPMELKGMRYLRGMKPNEMSRIIGIPMDRMLEYENSVKSIAPSEIAVMYVVALRIMPNEHLKLKALLNGETDEYITNRKIPAHIKREVFKKDNGMCTKCGSSKKLHYHHIKHFARGGKHEVDNLTLLCEDCHIEEHKEDRIYMAMKTTSKR